MHELAICQAVLRQVEDIAQPQAAAVQKVVIRIGPLSGVDADLLARAYPIATAGTVADGSELVVETAEVIVRCRQCGVSSHATASRLLCAACGDWRTKLIAGDELLLLRVELTQPVEV